MTENQLLVFGGVVMLFGMRQPLMALAWLVSVVMGVLPEDYYGYGIMCFFLFAFFLNMYRSSK